MLILNYGLLSFTSLSGYLVALTPGPAVMYAMTQATRYDFRQAMIGIAGIQLGHFFTVPVIAVNQAQTISIT